MKRIKYIILTIICLLIFPFVVSAASGTVDVTGTSTAVVGNNVTIKVTLSSNTLIGSWQMNLKYDKDYLQLTNTDAEGGGTRMANSSSSGTYKKTYTYTFRTLKTGSTSVTVDSYLAYDYNNPTESGELSLASYGKNVQIITQKELEASYSKDNNLKSLSVEGYDLTPTFNKDVLEYSVVVPEDTKEINIKAAVSDSKSSVSGAGAQEVTSGSNSFPIVVRAQNGAEKTYTINVEVKDENPINVKIDNVNYTVVKIKENLPTVNYYNEYTVKINNFEIPAYKNSNTNLVLIGLKKENGDISLFIYDESTKEYKPYQEIGVNKITIYPLNTDKSIKDYTKGTVEINGKSVDCFYYNESSNYVIIYGINVETGEEGFYTYDKDNQVAMKYNDEYINDLQNKMNLYTYIIIGFSVILVIMFLILILQKKKPKKKKETDENIVNYELISEKKKNKKNKKRNE